MNILSRKKIDNQTMSFLNLIENFSRNEDDIINILDKANQYMNEPIRSLVNQFVIDARLKGNINESFDKLIGELEGSKLSDVMTSLKLCAEHDSNYEMVIKDSKKSVRIYLKSLSVRNAIIGSARVDMAALFISLIIIVRLLDSFLSESVWMIMKSSYIGIGIMVYFGILCIVSVWILF